MNRSTLFFCLTTAAFFPHVGFSQATYKGPQPSATIPGGIQIVTFTQAWNADKANVAINYKNYGQMPLKIYGVQTTSNFFVEDFEKEIGAGKTGAIRLLYAGRPQTQSVADIVRLNTNQGERVIEIVHDRQQVVQFSGTKLTWKVGEKASEKSVTLTVSPGTTFPTKVRAGNGKNKVVLQKTGAHTYDVKITPTSTAKADEFPVFIDFDPVLPGVAGVIYCTVSSA